MTGGYRATLAEIGVVILVAIVAITFFLDVYAYSPAARLMPLIFLYVIAGLLILKVLSLARQWADSGRGPGALSHSGTAPAGETADVEFETEPLTGRQLIVRTAAVIGSVFAYLALIQVVGLFAAMPVFIFLFAWVLGHIQWYWSVALAFGTWLLTYLLFVRLLGLPTLPGILWE